MSAGAAWLQGVRRLFAAYRLADGVPAGSPVWRNTARTTSITGRSALHTLGELCCRYPVRNDPGTVCADDLDGEAWEVEMT